MNLVHSVGMRRLPPFDALIAFDAALRCGSMTGAAAELGLTQSAVSHRVRRLEAFMGSALMQRLAAGLKPTPAGEALRQGLPELLDGMADLRRRCLAAAGPDSLRVSVSAALADNWLVRRLPDFAAAYPGIAVELVVVENEAPARTADVDLRVLWTSFAEARAATTQQPLFREQVFPICHPSLLPRGVNPGDGRVLRDLPLLQKGPPGRPAGPEWSWAVWFARLGLPAPAEGGLRFASVGPTIAAAERAAGVALARSMLVHDALAEGRLVRLLPTAWDMPSSKVHVMRWPAALRTDARVTRFATWLLAQARATLATAVRRSSARAPSPSAASPAPPRPRSSRAGAPRAAARSPAGRAI